MAKCHMKDHRGPQGSRAPTRRAGRWAVALWLVGAAAAASGAPPIPDVPVKAFEPALGPPRDDRLVSSSSIAWADDHTVLVTAASSGNSNFWERKVASVNVRSGEVRDLANPGHVLCANAAEKVVGLAMGSDEAIFTGAKVPRSQPTWFDWRSGLSREKPSDQGWNARECRRVGPSEASNQLIAPWMRPNVLYLEPRDGFLVSVIERTKAESTVALTRGDNPVKVLDLSATDLPTGPWPHVRFLNAYLLSAGQFESGSAPMPAQPMVTVSHSGEIVRQQVAPLFEHLGPNVTGFSLPYAKGILVMAIGRPQDGGGVYLVEKNVPRRIWCSNEDPDQPGGGCRYRAVQVSPDGCHVAFFSRWTNDPAVGRTLPVGLKVLRLCK